MYTYNENKNALRSFYANLKFTGFKTITPERKTELDEIILKWYSFFYDGKTDSRSLAFMARVARRLSGIKPFNLQTGDERAYFFINIVDPDLILLECYESANFKDQLRTYCALNFPSYDKRLVILEKYYNLHFKIFDPKNIWTLERIKKEY